MRFDRPSADNTTGWLQHLAHLAMLSDDLPDPATPLGQLTREFLRNSWESCRDGLLARTQRIRVQPELNPFSPDPDPVPRVFRFEIDLPFKHQRRPGGPIELAPGPIRGSVIYRANMLSNLDEPSVAVRLDPALGLVHPNFSREHALLCLGQTTDFQGPIPLDVLLGNHVFPIVSYQNRHPEHPADLEAARYFALDPEAMVGLEPVSPLY